MRTFAIMNRKGGVGKTTTAIELAHNLATRYGQRVLLIDADSQANATGCLGRSNEMPAHGLEWVLQGLCEEGDAIIGPTDWPHLDIVPAGEKLADYELMCTLGRTTPAPLLLRSWLELLAEEEQYDTVVIDCPPYYSVPCIAALSCCDSVVIPTGTDVYSAEGLDGLVRQIQSLRAASQDVHIAGALVTKYRKSPMAEDAVALLREEAPIHVYRTMIRSSVKAEESSWAGKPVGDWSPWSAAAKDYRAWVDELVREEGLS